MTVTDTWRPMAFGAQAPKRIRDPLCEPLWAGERVLAEIGAGRVTLRDRNGGVLDGYDELRAALGASAYASEAIVDGYLLPAPIRDTVGAEAPLGMETTPTSGQIGRTMIFGGGGTNRRREEKELAAAREVDLQPDRPTAFIAVDLLWLDGESRVDVPLLERKRLLDSVITEHDLVRRTVVVRPPVEAWYGQWRALGFREYAVKAANSRYEPGGASDHWTTAPIPKR
jgi:ATP-dependent DNA ligase